MKIKSMGDAKDAGVLGPGVTDAATASSRAMPLVGHERLLALQRDQNVVVVEAPSGYGKTLLAKAWLNSAPPDSRRALVSLKPASSDPAVFLGQLIESINGSVTSTGEPAFESGKIRGDAFNDLAEFLIDPNHETWLVIDDAHYVAESQSRHNLHRLILGASDGFRILITTQVSSLDIGLGSLASEGRLSWIGARALALTRDEIGLLAQLRGIALETSQLDWLYGATQGWPALVHLSLANPTENVPSLNADLTKSGPMVDYIYERFLSRLEETERDVLWVLACLGSAPMRLIELVVTKPAPAVHRLSGLGVTQEQSALDALGRPIRLHPLVRDAVLKQWSAEREEGRAALMLTAAKWYMENELGTDAITLLLDAGPQHLPMARDWLATYSSALVFIYGHHETLLSLARRVQTSLPEPDPKLDKMIVWAMLFLRRFDEARERIDNTSSQPAPWEEETLQLAIMAALKDDYQTGTRLSFEWLDYHRHEPTFFTGAALAAFGFGLKCQGDVSGALTALREAHIIFSRIRSHFGVGWIHVVTSLALMKAGRHRDALAEVERGLDHSAGRSGLLGGRAMLRSVEAFVRYERNDLAGARVALDEALPIIVDHGVADPIVFAVAAAARLRVAEDDLGGALDILSEGERDCAQHMSSRLTLSLVAERALILARVGASRQAAYTAEAAGISPAAASSGRGVLADRAGRLFARLALVGGDHAGARALLTPSLAHARAAGQRYKLCELLLLTALAEDMAKREASAFEALLEALELGMSEDYVRVFIDEGPDLHALLRRLLVSESGGRGRSAISWGKKINSLVSAPAKAKTGDSETLIEPLNKREQQILALLDLGLSNLQISQRCFIGEGTVKWHLHNLYSKLGVNSRTAALRVGRASGLIAS